MCCCHSERNHFTVNIPFIIRPRSILFWFQHERKFHLLFFLKNSTVSLYVMIIKRKRLRLSWRERKKATWCQPFPATFFSLSSLPWKEEAKNTKDSAKELRGCCCCCKTTTSKTPSTEVAAVFTAPGQGLSHRFVASSRKFLVVFSLLLRQQPCLPFFSLLTNSNVVKKRKRKRHSFIWQNWILEECQSLTDLDVVW